MAFARAVAYLAVATPFLLSPSCHSLHVMEGGHGPEETLIFATHHKTGTELVKAVSECFDSSFKYALDVHWKGGPLRPHERALHFIRNPLSLALSAYLYHKESGEKWSFEPGSAWTYLGQDEHMQQLLINKHESYTDFLRRVDAKNGIRAELIHLSLGELNHIERADQLCKASSQCMQICLEDFTVSSSSYEASWRKVMDFMGQHMTWHLQQCLSKQDLNKYPKDENSHITYNSMPKWRYNALKKLVAEVDAKEFNSRLKKMGVGRLNCGAPYFLHTQSGSNATEGGEYPGWLIEEKYS